VPSNLRGKWIAIIAVVIGCVIGLTGLPKSVEELAANWEKNVRLGLDLKGGSHIVLQIQVQDAFKAEADTQIDVLKSQLAKGGIVYQSIDRNEPSSIDTAGSIAINIRGVDASKVADFRRVVNDATGTSWNLGSEGTQDYRLTLRKEAAIKLREDTLTQSMSTIERKVNGLGVAEASVQRRGGTGGDAEMLVQLPGVDDPVRVKAILQTSAMLQLAEVKGGPYQSREAAMSDHGGMLPLSTRLAPSSRRSSDADSNGWWLLAQSPVVTGRDLRDARAQQSDQAPGRWDTGFVLTQDASGRFERFTSANIGKRLAIVLDGAVLSAPSIEGAISDQGVIMGVGDQQAAADLALNLRSGSLPAGAKVIEERIVGPSLGADSIRRGVSAGAVGLALVIISMIGYYRGAGWNAVLALLLNTLMTVAALSYVEATWTLPGIAGLVLSIGMAVDSNVLIFERIKEEMRAGKAVAGAISSGFDRALVTIIDTHVTTVVASAFLFIFGTGPVRGFAVTLVVGLVANLFTAVFVSRAIFDLKLWRHPRLASLSIGKEWLPQTNFDFLSKRSLTIGLSALAILISVGALAVRGGPKYGIDFRGGMQTYVRFDPKPPIDEVRQALSAKLNIGLQETKGTGEFIIGTELADESTLDQARQSMETVLREKYAALGGKLDLNNATQAALAGSLRSALPGFDETELQGLAGRILSYRDRVKGGVVGSIDELSNVQGVDVKVLSALRESCGLATFNIRSVEIVGPRAGEQLRRQAVLATACALGGMLLFIAFRFQWISGAAAVIATIHDVIITLGLFALTNREIDLTIIAALLTLIGYSMNDKIVVFDRVRENMQGKKPASSFAELVNLSINQTLSRTLLTAGPTLLACLALYFLGGEVLNGIAFALFAGIVVGTYSSIFVASAILVMWDQYRRRKPVGVAA
jgi:preprotein translocase subunit SecD